MSKEKPFEKRIPAFYRKSTIDLLLFCWINAAKYYNDNKILRRFYKNIIAKYYNNKIKEIDWEKAMKDIIIKEEDGNIYLIIDNDIALTNKMTIEQAFDDFIDFYGIDEEDYPLDSAKVIYNTIKTNFLWKEAKEKI